MKYFIGTLILTFLLFSCQEPSTSSGDSTQETETSTTPTPVTEEELPASPSQQEIPEFETAPAQEDSLSSNSDPGSTTSTPAVPSSPSTQPTTTSAALGKDYEVISVEGKIRNTRNQESLKAGSRIRPGDVLQFGKTSDELVLVDAEKRLYTASPGSDLQSYQLESLRGASQGRPGKILSYVAFQQFLKGKKWLVMGGKVDLEIGEAEFPMDAQHFFYIEYQYNGEAIPKKLEHRGKILSIEKNALYKVDGVPIPASKTRDSKLYYYNTVEETSLLINPINLIFPDESKLVEEVGVLVKSYGSRPADREELLAAITQFLTNKYGSPEKEDLSDWVKEKFGV